MIEDGSGTAHPLGSPSSPSDRTRMGHRPTGTRRTTRRSKCSGTARFTVRDSQREAPAGTFVSVPVGAEHTFANTGDEPAIILNTFTPDLYVGYFRDLGQLAASGEMTPDAIL